MNIQAIYLIGSESRGTYANLIQICTSGKLTHVALVFYLGRDGEEIPPISTSTANQNAWLVDNDVNIGGELEIHIDSIDYDIELENGFYVFETNNDISQVIHAPTVIKAPGQISGCVITPLETYRKIYHNNVIIELVSNPSLFIMLIKQFWGKPYGIDSIFNNLNSNLSMVCTHLSARYVNSVYSKNYDMFSPTKFVHEVGRIHEDEDFHVDDFLDQKFLKYHYLWSILPLILIGLITFGVFMYVVNHRVVIENSYQGEFRRDMITNNNTKS